MDEKSQEVITFQPERTRYTAACNHGKVTVYRLSKMTPEEIELHGLTKYVKKEVDVNDG